MTLEESSVQSPPVGSRAVTTTSPSLRFRIENVEADSVALVENDPLQAHDSGYKECRPLRGPGLESHDGGRLCDRDDGRSGGNGNSN